MEVTGIETVETGRFSDQQEIRLREAAKQFEAVLLTQLTSVLNKADPDSDSLFGSDGGSDLARKLFSEQLAIAMADAGGIGISDTILSQFGVEAQKAKPVVPVQPAAVSGDTLDPIPSRKPERADSFGNTRSNEQSNPIGIVSTDSENSSVRDDIWRLPFTSPEYGIDYTKPENQIPAAASVGYSMPLDGRISSRFGIRFHPIERTQKFHAGVDIAAPKGTPIKAAADGIVVFAGRRGGYGKLVIVEHGDGRTTRYAHAESISVKKGQRVDAGEVIARVGATGDVTGPHLHFEVRENGKPVNPMALVN